MNAINNDRSDLQQLRQEIDDLDNQILRLLNQRMLLVEEIAELKNKAGRDAMDLHREQAIFRRLASQNQGPLAWPIECSKTCTGREIKALICWNGGWMLPGIQKWRPFCRNLLCRYLPRCAR
ncbi:MAG: chorismate mutase [Deltaproteobacteria bacterium]